MAVKRPYFNLSIIDLENIFIEKSNDLKTLKLLKNELTHRTRPRAKELLKKS